MTPILTQNIGFYGSANLTVQEICITPTPVAKVTKISKF